jgi:hypothetical protein
MWTKILELNHILSELHYYIIIYIVMSHAVFKFLNRHQFPSQNNPSISTTLIKWSPQKTDDRWHIHIWRHHNSMFYIRWRIHKWHHLNNICYIRSCIHIWHHLNNMCYIMCDQEDMHTCLDTAMMKVENSFSFKHLATDIACYWTTAQFKTCSINT